MIRTLSPKWNNRPFPGRPAFTVAESSIALLLCLIGSGIVVSLALGGMKQSLWLEEDRVAREDLENLRERSLVAGAAGIGPQWAEDQKPGAAALARLGKVRLETKVSFIDPTTGKSADEKVADRFFPRRVDAKLVWYPGATRGNANLSIPGTDQDKKPGEPRFVTSWWVLGPLEAKKGDSKKPGASS